MVSAAIQAGRDNPLLTGIRGIAAIWVSLFHFYPWISAVFGLVSRGRVPFVRDGFLGVDLFFLLSGFVLMLSYGPRLAHGAPSAIGRFMVSRMFRILPMHWTVLFALAAIVSIAPAIAHPPFVFTRRAFFESFLLVQGLLPDATVAWNRPTWSISDEFMAYLLFPLLAPLIWSCRSARLAAAIAVLALVSLGLAARFGLGAHILDLVYPGGPLRCFFEFSAGALACKAWQLDRDAVLRLGTPLTIGGVLVLVAAIRYSSHLDMLAPFGLLALVVGSGARAPAAAILFGSPAAVFLGEISYSLYLIHIVLFDLLYLPSVMPLVMALPPPAKVCVGLLVWCVLLVLSWLGYRHIEQPFRTFGGHAVRRAFPARSRG